MYLNKLGHGGDIAYEFSTVAFEKKISECKICLLLASVTQLSFCQDDYSQNNALR